MYDDDHFKRLRRNYLRDCRPEEYERLSRADELEAHLQERTDACRKEAARLVETGTTFEAQAWQWAIRTELLEQPWD